MNYLITLLLILIFSNVMAKNVVDLYGLSDKKSTEILKRYGTRVEALAQLAQTEVKKIGLGKNNMVVDELLIKKKQLTEQIKREYRFLYVDFDHVLYPGDQNAYVTIEVIDRNHPERLYFLTKNSNKNPVQREKRSSSDVIDEMIKYQQISSTMIIKNDKTSLLNCPVYHCIASFEGKILKPYLDKFNRGVHQDRTLILHTLRNGIMVERRVSAAYLLGHLTNPYEIIQLLTPFVKDKNVEVRNAAMRVIGMTMQKANITTIDIMPFLAALNSPYDTDRNKALLILLAAADGHKAQRVLFKKGLKPLLANFQLKQPNNHLPAYLILKKISGKDFGEQNVDAWKKWASI